MKKLPLLAHPCCGPSSMDISLNKVEDHRSQLTKASAHNFFSPPSREKSLRLFD